jgi:hypothetical protein
MNPAAKREYVRRRNIAFKIEMRQTKGNLLKRARSLSIKVTKDMTKEQIVKRLIGWKSVI